MPFPMRAAGFMLWKMDTVVASFLLSLYLLQLSLRQTVQSYTIRCWSLDYLFLRFKEHERSQSCIWISITVSD